MAAAAVAGAIHVEGGFWGGLGAALLFGGAFYFASRDSGGDTIHLQMKVP